MFNEKSKCLRCKSKVKDSWDFCPYCGLDLSDPERDMRDFGSLGKSDFVGGAPLAGGLGGLGITDKMINSVFNSLMKNLEKQMGNSGSEPEIQNFPRGVKIRVEVPRAGKGENKEKKAKRGISPEQVERMSKLPRAEAKTSVRRLSDKVVYELKVLDVDNPEDVFISKLEEGYEVKAIGKKKVYVNSLPVNLPLKGVKVGQEGLFIEFGAD